MKWLQKAAGQSHAEAQNLLGFMYDNGHGVERNITEAFKWFRKAAENDDMEGMFNVGICYSFGKGVDKDLITAAECLEKSANKGMSRAQYRLGVHYAKGEGVTKNNAEAAKWYQKAKNKRTEKYKHVVGGVFADLNDAKQKAEIREAACYNKAYIKMFALYDSGQQIAGISVKRKISHLKASVLADLNLNSDEVKGKSTPVATAKQVDAQEKVIPRRVGSYVTYDFTREINIIFLEDVPFSASNDRVTVILYGGNSNVKGAAQFATEQFALKIHDVSYIEVPDNDTDQNNSVIGIYAEGRNLGELDIGNNAPQKDIARTVYTMMLEAHKRYIVPYLAVGNKQNDEKVKNTDRGE